MNMSTWAIRNPVPPIALFLVLCIAGWVSFMRLPVTQMPNVDIPIVTIAVAQPGAAPSEIVSQIVRPIETAVGDVTGVRHVSASATDSSANLTIEFAIGTNTDRALNDVKDAVASVRDELPESATEPLVQRLDVTGQAILTYAVSDPTRSIQDLSTFVDDVVARDLQLAAGVGRVTRFGGAERQILVDLDPDRLLALGLGAADVNAQLVRANINLGGGSGDLAGQEYSIRTLGSAETLEGLAATAIRLPTGDTVRLDQLGTVSDGASELDSFALLDAQPVVAFGVFRATGASDLLAAENAKARLEALSQHYPDVRFALVDDATIYTEASYHSAMDTLYEGAALAVIVVFLFLRDWRATLVTAVALPLSILPTFIVLDLLGFTLNTVSLLGITLVTGILVDDAIVEIENIVRHMQGGKPAYEASEEAATEIGLTVIAISFTIVAVFAPVSFMGGIAGQFFKQFGITVAVAVLFSLLVARLITPMFAAYFLRNGHGMGEAKDGWLMRTYLAILGWTLRHRLVTLLAGAMIFAGSIYSATLLPTEFLPATDTGRARVSVELPPGSLLSETRTVAQEVTARLDDIPEVRSVFVSTDSETAANVQVDFGQKNERDRSAPEITAEIEERLADIADVRLFVLNENGQRDISINVLGDTQDATAAAARALAEEMRTLPQLRDASTDAALVRPEIQITPKPQIAAELGITAASLASTVRTATIGESETNLAKFNAGDEQIPIVVRLEERARNDLMRIAGLRVPTETGTPVPLVAVADVRLSTGPSSIDRYDRQYRTSVEADLAEGALLGPATAAVMQLPTTLDMPDGTAMEAGGDVETMNEIFESFALAMGAGILLVYIVLVLLFSSFITPVTILLSLPLAIGGAIFALYLYGAGIGISVVIGFLMLMGIVTKNAIMLVEFAIEAMHRGETRAAAMIDAGHKRARPIIMTTIAMAAGMVPSAIGSATGGEFRAPMAVAVIGGLLLSTLLSLLFVPSLFSVLEGVRSRSRRLLTRMLGFERRGPASPEGRPVA
ncbi:efflux RND transporter permease subunit [Antarcticirhabdus aurantiaca]|uniref:Efflux RND transporter permease subunit n=1 Tax=Antarcticirhabdus aurantiaca TaxID=2606717 RepID=A0ACD4NSC5_9HYPH|nr:efflux RND transporter permease subunit [Antarcticirhabdus aurantiaca]WAJ29638.1 efflux RND transporter permease subunit [Jeongeuplla avenae]